MRSSTSFSMLELAGVVSAVVGQMLRGHSLIDALGKIGFLVMERAPSHDSDGY